MYFFKLNIPLSLPQLPCAGAGSSCGQYEDDPTPLRVHDCSLDLQIVCEPNGVVCICHHYLYKPLDDSTSSLVLEESIELKDSGVNFAYSITLLHHGCVVHSVVPDLPWTLAKSLRPSYTLYGENHLLVMIPMLFTHLLDISLSHEPCCHIVIPCEETENGPNLAHLLGWGPNTMVDLNTLDIVTLNILEKDLVSTFKSDSIIENKLAIMHYLIQHEGNGDLAEEFCPQFAFRHCYGLDTDSALRLGPAPYAYFDYTLNSGIKLVLDLEPSSIIYNDCVYKIAHEAHGGRTPAIKMVLMVFPVSEMMAEVNDRMMQEFLIGTTYSITKRALPSSALSLMRVLPFTQHQSFADVKVRDVCVSVSQEKLWNSAVVLLEPRQRISQFSEDMWTRLWELLSSRTEQKRFKCTQVLDKLRVSLHCYQPEALSRCSTPMSPTGAAPSLVAAPARRSSLGNQSDMLPFFEIDVCTASKQEHVIAANLREVSVHLMRGCSSGSSTSRNGGVESGVHAVATRWAAAQLDASRALCRTACRAVAAAPQTNQHRGFTFIDEMEQTHALILFKVLEQYYFAADSIAFPLPQGFTSFFSYLGYRTLPFSSFVQYVHRNVFELQIDVMKAIFADKDDTSRVSQKLRLLQLVGEGRARRTLSGWNHQAALVLRARHHASTLLAGQPQRDRHHARECGTSFPSGERLSPLDTFLDLLTAKASLNELDFNLIIEATMAMMQSDEAY
ncbi:Protein pigeon [Eumeta japonica]|uniref:Protein pigeon n=1 Tax=Eumeta variegata TaxID=151549 RepID=A0A4C1WUX5_EUMVA|nr:Protein pigeon [Eumeta japonica]